MHALGLFKVLTLMRTQPENQGRAMEALERFVAEQWMVCE